MEKKLKIPTPTVERLPLYLRCLGELREQSVNLASSHVMSMRTGVKASQFRKDLSCFGEFGIQGLGYPVGHLYDKIAAILGVDKEQEAVLIGAGNLGSALVNYPGFTRWGFRITQAYDNNPRKIGRSLGNIVIRSVSDLPGDLHIRTGILAVPASAAQESANLLIKSGVRAILNFAGYRVAHGKGIFVRDVDLSWDLAVLSYCLLGESQAQPGAEA
jgi:redox-sensing transcriptional repressor